MITNVTNSTEMRLALNENLHGLLTGKRKPLIVKEVNNTLGKLQNDVKMEIMVIAISGVKHNIAWFDSVPKIGSAKQLDNKKAVAV